MVMTRSPSRLVLVSSRPEKIEQDFFQSFCCLGGARIQGNKSVSTASSPSGNKDVSQSEVLCWYIEPFTPDKIKAYVKKYAQFGGSQGERSAELFNQHRELLKGQEQEEVRRLEQQQQQRKQFIRIVDGAVNEPDEA
ncbi:hypothetical protein Pelo_19727 [Pelomyxa schiedti]|nr:hypothetical protein Pelo_19727 [Pelomyxa schiedti]